MEVTIVAPSTKPTIACTPRGKLSCTKPEKAESPKPPFCEVLLIGLSDLQLKENPFITIFYKDKILFVIIVLLF